MKVFNQHHSMPQDGEWDVDLVDDEPGKVAMIADNKWVKLLLIPVHFVLLFVLGIAAIVVCSLVISPIFVVWKCGYAFLEQCQDVYKSFKRDD